MHMMEYYLVIKKKTNPVFFKHYFLKASLIKCVILRRNFNNGKIFQIHYNNIYTTIQ